MEGKEEEKNQGWLLNFWFDPLSKDDVICKENEHRSVWESKFGRKYNEFHVRQVEVELHLKYPSGDVDEEAGEMDLVRRTRIWSKDMNWEELNSGNLLMGKKGRVGKVMCIFPAPKGRTRCKWKSHSAWNWSLVWIPKKDAELVGKSH